jgi:hypothetical protein
MSVEVCRKPHRSANHNQIGTELATKKTKNILISLDHNTEHDTTVISKSPQKP